jgi:hypothetical protein
MQLRLFAKASVHILAPLGHRTSATFSDIASLVAEWGALTALSVSSLRDIAYTRTLYEIAIKLF